MQYQGNDAFVCPLVTLLYWRFTGGLYYEFVGVSEFANEFGEGFQNYVGDVIKKVCVDPMVWHGEKDYVVGKAKNAARTGSWPMNIQPVRGM
jgi:hypothetical protein